MLRFPACRRAGLSMTNGAYPTSCPRRGGHLGGRADLKVGPYEDGVVLVAVGTDLQVCPGPSLGLGRSDFSRSQMLRFPDGPVRALSMTSGADPVAWARTQRSLEEPDVSLPRLPAGRAQHDKRRVPYFLPP